MTKRKEKLEEFEKVIRKELECIKELIRVEKGKEEELKGGLFSDRFEGWVMKSEGLMIEIEMLEKKRGLLLDFFKASDDKEYDEGKIFNHFDNSLTLRKEMREELSRLKKIESGNRSMMEDGLKLIKYSLDLYRIDKGKELEYGAFVEGGIKRERRDDYHPYLLDTKI